MISVRVRVFVRAGLCAGTSHFSFVFCFFSSCCCLQLRTLLLCVYGALLCMFGHDVCVYALFVYVLRVRTATGARTIAQQVCVDPFYACADIAYMRMYVCAMIRKHVACATTNTTYCFTSIVRFKVNNTAVLRTGVPAEYYQILVSLSNTALHAPCFLQRKL